MRNIKSLQKLSKKELILGSNLAFDNGEQLMKSAKLISLEVSYGTANSLFILALEEFIKSFVLYFYALTGIDSGKLLGEVFSKHKSKHDVWYLIKTLDVLIKTFINAIVDVKEFELQKKVKTEDCGSLLLNKINLVFKQWALVASDPLDEITDWVNKANSNKNAGFYVDYQDNDWLTPLSISKEEYLQTQEHTENFIFNLKEFRSLSEPDLLPQFNQ